ncbi:hypothetical protein HWV62_36999 [Athelia sp. TMB]|nr:hypothetical protein HWV62_36999 [Athelia sp. TMB]
MVLPVLPPGGPHRGADHEILSDTTDTFDGESYVDIPRDINSPSEHLRAPSLHDGAHPPAPVMQREGGHIPGSFEPSRHNFAPGSSTGDTSSDVSDSPRPHRARGIEDPRYGHRGGDRHHDMRNYRGGRGHPRDFGSPMSSHSSDSNGMVIPPQMDSPHSSSSRSREFDSPRPQRRPMERDIESPRYPGGYAGRDMAHGPVHMSTPSPESNGMVIPPHMDSPHSSSSRSHGFDSPRSSPGRPRERGSERPRHPGGYPGPDMTHGSVHPVPIVPSSETEDSELTEGRMHPAFRGESQVRTLDRTLIVGILTVSFRALTHQDRRESFRRSLIKGHGESMSVIHKALHHLSVSVLCRTPGYGEPEDRVSYMDHYGNTPNIILLDREGRQIPM